MHKHDIKKKLTHLMEKYPDKIIDFAENLMEEYGDDIMDYIDEQIDGCHIKKEKMYDEAVELLKNPDGHYGAKWSEEDIERKSGIDFNHKKYTILDYVYTVNMMYSDYGDIIKDPDLIFKMAKNYLEDDDYMGDPSERAYHNAKKRIKYFEDK